MLWTDGDFVSAAELASLDNEVQLVASAEGIMVDDVGQIVGVIHRAIEESADAILKHMQEFGGAYCGDGGVTPGHYAAVMNTGVPRSIRTSVLVNQVVVSGPTAASWTALKRWVAYWALMMFYRDAANRTNNDRYADKAAEYRKDLFGIHWQALRAKGLPTVSNPLPCPGAKYEPEAGTWGTSNVSLVNGAGTLTTEWDVVTTYVDSSRSSNGESGPSARVSIPMQAGKLLQVDINSLMPPNGAQPAYTRALATVPYGRATGWNVYAGPKDGSLYKQTVTPVDIATKVYTFAADPVTGTAQAGLGQVPESYREFHNWVHRG